MDEVKPIASLNLIQERNFTARKLIETPASVCSIYGVDFRISTEKHELGFGEHVCQLINCLSVNFSAYNLLSNRKEGNSKYDTLIVKVLNGIAVFI